MKYVSRRAMPMNTAASVSEQLDKEHNKQQPISLLDRSPPFIGKAVRTQVYISLTKFDKDQITTRKTAYPFSAYRVS